MYLWGRSRGAAGGEDEGRLSEVPRGAPAHQLDLQRSDGVGYPAEGAAGRAGAGVPVRVRIGPGPVGAFLSACSSSTRF